MGHAMVAGGARASAPITGILAGYLAVGSSVYLMENGVAAEYLVVNQGKPSGSSRYDDSCNGTWLLRKDIFEKRQWHSSSDNSYKASTIHTYLNGTFFNLFGSVEQNIIKEVKIPYVNGTGSGGSVASGANGLSAKIFLLSGYEVGFTKSVSSYFPIDGEKLDYFTAGDTVSVNEKRIAYLNGMATNWWLRSPNNDDTNRAWTVYTSGGCGDHGCSYSYGIRPALVLPSNALFDKNTLLLKGVA